jgi:hypothetical protein
MQAAGGRRRSRLRRWASCSSSLSSSPLSSWESDMSSTPSASCDPSESEARSASTSSASTSRFLLNFSTSSSRSEASGEAGARLPDALGLPIGGGAIAGAWGAARRSEGRRYGRAEMPGVELQYAKSSTHRVCRAVAPASARKHGICAAGRNRVACSVCDIKIALSIISAIGSTRLGTLAAVSARCAAAAFEFFRSHVSQRLCATLDSYTVHTCHIVVPLYVVPIRCAPSPCGCPGQLCSSRDAAQRRRRRVAAGPAAGAGAPAGRATGGPRRGLGRRAERAPRRRGRRGARRRLPRRRRRG